MMANQLIAMVPTMIPTNILPIMLLMLGVITELRNLKVEVIIEIIITSLTTLRVVDNNESYGFTTNRYKSIATVIVFAKDSWREGLD